MDGYNEWIGYPPEWDLQDENKRCNKCECIIDEDDELCIKCIEDEQED
jgi:hypothetical protein